jgi:predicted nucleic acid-binding protein
VPVVDASVALKLVLAEADLDRAENLFERCTVLREPLLAPSHSSSEAVNAINRRLRGDGQSELTEDQAELAVVRYLALPLQLVTPPRLYEDAFTFALRHKLPSIYDSLYVALAESLRTELWTADQRLLQSVGKAAPWVRSIQEYS